MLNFHLRQIRNQLVFINSISVRRMAQLLELIGIINGLLRLLPDEHNGLRTDLDPHRRVGNAGNFHNRLPCFNRIAEGCVRVCHLPEQLCRRRRVSIQRVRGYALQGAASPLSLERSGLDDNGFDVPLRKYLLRYCLRETFQSLGGVPSQ